MVCDARLASSHVHATHTTWKSSKELTAIIRIERNCIQDLHQVCVQLLRGPKAGMAVSPCLHAILDTATSCRLLSILSGLPILQISQILTCYGIEDFCFIQIALFVYHFMGGRDLVWSHELYVISIFMMPSY